MYLNHHRAGRGEPLVLLHGIGSQCQVWAPVLDRLAAERDVAAVDLPGFGGSPPLRSEPPTVPALARAVAAFCREQLGWPTAHVVGNSLGGSIALELARTGFARSACALSANGFQRGLDAAWLQAILLTARALARGLRPVAGASVARPLVAPLLLPFVAHPGRVPPARLAEALVNLARSPGFRPTLRHAIAGWRWPGGEPACPVTIAWGTRDGVLLPVQARRAERLLPQARHLPLPGLAHFPMWDRPDLVAELILEASSAVSTLAAHALDRGRHERDRDAAGPLVAGP